MRSGVGGGGLWLVDAGQAVKGNGGVGKVVCWCCVPMGSTERARGSYFGLLWLILGVFLMGRHGITATARVNQRQD